MKHQHKLMTATFSALLVCIAPAFGDEDAVKFSAWDANDNGMVSLAEWDAGIEEHDVFENLDRNNSGTFDIEEAVESVIEYDVAMDLDDGGHIERQEFTVATFDSYDVNDDDNLSETEFMKFGTMVMGSPLLSSN